MKIVEPTPQNPKSSSTLTLNTEETKSKSPSKEIISGQSISGSGKSADAISGQSADATSGSGQSADAISGQSADAISGQSADATSSSTGNEKPKASSLSNEDLAKMWQAKSRPSLAQRLKCKWISKKNFRIATTQWSIIMNLIWKIVMTCKITILELLGKNIFKSLHT